MIPSNEKGVVGILNTYEECLIVDDYFYGRDQSAHERQPATFEELQSHPRTRFIHEAMELEKGYATDDEPYLRHNPSFRVLKEDLDWISEAVNNVLYEQGLVRRAINRITRRRRAAEGIAAFISRYQQIDATEPFMR